MGHATDEINRALPLSSDLRIHDQCKAFEGAGAAISEAGTEPPKIASFIQAAAGSERVLLVKELVLLDLEFRSRVRAAVDREHYLAELPGCEDIIDGVLAEYQPDEDALETAAVNSTAENGALPVAGTATPAAPTQPAPADAVRVGRYILLERLGVGGMGAVYKAWHPLLKRYVAIKLIRPDLTGNAAAIRRFLSEIEAVGRIDHPHIVRAHDAGVEGGQYHLVLELVDGRSVSQLLEMLGQWPVPEACEAVRQAALGLQKIHECGMVHRDVKPSNLMLTQDGVVKILDLGLSRLQPDWPGTRETRSGDALGTADYMAPEQAGEGHDADVRADVYGLGCTLYHLLAGRAPFGDSRHS